MKNKCYWLVDLNDVDIDMFWYTTEDHEIGETVVVNGVSYRIIEKDVF